MLRNFAAPNRPWPTLQSARPRRPPAGAFSARQSSQADRDHTNAHSPVNARTGYPAHREIDNDSTGLAGASRSAGARAGPLPAQRQCGHESGPMALRSGGISAKALAVYSSLQYFYFITLLIFMQNQHLLFLQRAAKIKATTCGILRNSSCAKMPHVYFYAERPKFYESERTPVGDRTGGQADAPVCRPLHYFTFGRRAL